MNFNIDKAKELLKIFSKLDEKKQNELLAKAFEMKFEQSNKARLEKTGLPITDNNLSELRTEFLDMAKPLMDNWDNMGPNYHAALAILMNEMTDGKLTKEENIDFVISTRQLSISEYIEKHIPGANIEDAKKLYQSIKKDV